MPADFLDEVIEGRTARNPKFPAMVEDAEIRRTEARRLAACRERLGLSQTLVAARMRTSASVVSKLESGADVKLSTLIHYCQVIGQAWSFDPGKRRFKRTGRR